MTLTRDGRPEEGCFNSKGNLLGPSANWLGRTESGVSAHEHVLEKDSAWGLVKKKPSHVENLCGHK